MESKDVRFWQQTWARLLTNHTNYVIPGSYLTSLSLSHFCNTHTILDNCRLPAQRLFPFPNNTLTSF